MDKISKKIYRFKVPGRKLFSFTAQELYVEFIKEFDSERLIPVSKILDVCNDKDFPENYAKKIKLAFLKSFIVSVPLPITTGLFLADYSIFNVSFEERSALFLCYNSLSNTNQIEFNAKQEFLTKFLDDVTEGFILQEPTSTSDNYINACRIYKSWKQSFIKDLLKKDKIKFTCLRSKNLFKSFKKALVSEVGKKGFLEYIEENKSQQGDFSQYTKVATNI